jgi:acylphosphatase
LNIEGRVQGVGYRWSLCDQANRLGLSGWVRNRRDGSVEALVIGDNVSIDDLLAWAQRGPPMARVDKMTVSEGNTGELTSGEGFRQIATF